MRREITEVRKKIAELGPEDIGKRDDLEKSLLELIKLDEFATRRMNAYKADHANLQQQLDTIILTLDFTSAQTSMTDDFNDCVVVVATATPLPIPAGLSGHLVVAEQPPSFVAKPNLSEKTDESDINDVPQKRARRTKEQMIDQQIEYPKPKDNLRTDIENHIRRLELPIVCYLYLERLYFLSNLFRLQSLWFGNQN